MYVPNLNMWFMVWIAGHQATEVSRKIALAYSLDGKVWTQYQGARVNGNTNPVIMSGDDASGQSWEKDTSGISKLSVPTLFYENGIFNLYYADEASGTNRGKVGLSTFTWNTNTHSIENFVRSSANPIINLPQDTQFQSGIGHLDVAIGPNGNYYLYGLREIFYLVLLHRHPIDLFS